MQGVTRPRLAFVREMKQGVEKRFPQYEKNPYYKTNTGQEEQQLVAMQARSDLRFYLYYRLKLLVRRLRRK